MPKVIFYHLGNFSGDEGTGSVALNIAKRLSGFEIVYLSPQKLRKFLFYSFLSPIWFAAKAAREKPEIVFAVTPEAAFDAVVARKILGFKYKILVLFHGTPRGYLEAYYSELNKGVCQRNLNFELNLRIADFRSGFAKWAYISTCVSRQVIAEAKEYYGIDATQIPNGHEGRGRQKKSSDNGKILFVGNVYWGKGLYYLIKANNLLEKPRIIVAVGVGKDQVEQLKQLVDCSMVEFRGIISRKDLNKVYSECSVFAMPSIYEGFGLVYLEALAHGLPVIGSYGTGAEDIIKHRSNGVLVKKGDVEGLKNAILFLEKNKGRIRKNCFVEEKFLWDKIKLRYRSLFEKLLEKDMWKA